MRVLTTLEMLEVWERGLAQSPLQRSLTLLAGACGEPPEVVARLSIGQRDARLLTLCERTFGPQLAALARCPKCTEQLELNFQVADVRIEAETAAAESWLLSVTGYELRCRTPNSFDLTAIADQHDPV